MAARPGPERRQREARREAATRVRLTLAEREQLLVQLDRATAALGIVEDHLWVAQQRSGGTLGTATWAQLESLRELVSEVRGKVTRTPLAAD